MAIKLEDKTRVEGPSVDFPYGKIKDSTPTVKGTPVNFQVYSDFHQYFAKLLDEAGITANDLPDNFTDGFQYFQALVNVINSSVGKAAILMHIGPYTANDVVILYGCEVVDNIPGTSTITAGAIYYNDRIYYVPADAGIASPADTLVYKIDVTVQPEFIYLANDTTGSGIADFDASTVKAVNKIPKSNANVISFISSSFSGTFDVTHVFAVKRGGMVYISGTIEYTPSVVIPVNSSLVLDLSIPAEFRYLRDNYENGGNPATLGTAVIHKVGTVEDVWAVGKVRIGTSGDNQLKIVLGTTGTTGILPGPVVEISFSATYLAKDVI